MRSPFEEILGNAAELAAARLPPTPPETEDNESNASGICSFPLPPLSIGPSEVLDIDKDTPDCHVPRDPRLIRLTGVHPFNVEPPLSALYNEGFLTSPDLFYVRNHGAVPQVHEDEIQDWEFSIEGLVSNPMTITLRQLMSEYEQATYPITLVCAGNRRKEQNLVRKSKGFSWGSAGLSTALFTGVAMSEVIRRARPLRRARYVCMEGADKLPNGFYGTSVKLNWVMDPNRGIMLAYKMNGEILRPDHGKPLRAVIPGQIGGRSVKWLKKLTITDVPSSNWYHINDNRVLPAMVSPEESAENPHWWYDERYVIYDLNVNSAIAYPAHGEQLSLADSFENYRIKGYAYGGGGRRVGRVEISLDKGRTWRLSDINYPEDLYREAEQELYGGRLDMSWRESSFCWCFWSLSVKVSELDGASDILVRAMDEAMNIQPRDMYWSVLGMMNNPWFRVAIIKDGNLLRFEHPTQPAFMPGGWMEKIKMAGGDLTDGHWGEGLGGGGSTPRHQPVKAEEVRMTRDGVDRVVTIDELQKHNKADQPWIVLGGEVYDGTGFLGEHPGGAQSIISAAGMDSTEEFMAIHSETAKAMMPKYHIGSLDERSQLALREEKAQEGQSAAKRDVFLQQRVWTKAALVEKRIVSWDTRIFVFQLEHEEQTPGLRVGQHLMIRLRDPTTDEVVIRSYTPITEIKKKGILEVLIKIYFDTEETKGGKMTLAMDALPLGHCADFKGPTGKFEYIGRGKCSIGGNIRLAESFYMICAGSGITPIYQVLRAIMQDPEDNTHCTALDGNRTLEDILCKQDLDAFVSGNPGRCKIVYTLTKAHEEWEGARGRISGELIGEHMPRSDGALVLICGPKALEESVYKALSEQGWGDSDMVFF
ncbi:MAG: hypothetical protein M1840_007434 [Geoglossum simile]|nr:MAG: hypothetical protein M1840_007434 [Geoglossum simile]